MHAPYKHPKMHQNNINIEVDRYVATHEYSAGDIDEATKRIIAAWPEHKYDYEHTKNMLIERILAALKIKMKGDTHGHKHTV
jgi:hypothetical protein